MDDNMPSPAEPMTPPSATVHAAASELNHASQEETQVSPANPQVDEDQEKDLVLPLAPLSLASATEGTAAAESAKP